MKSSPFTDRLLRLTESKNREMFVGEMRLRPNADDTTTVQYSNWDPWNPTSWFDLSPGRGEQGKVTELLIDEVRQ